MKTRKEMKSMAKEVIKKHYITLLIVCFFAAFVGSEFSSSLSLTKIQDKVSEDEIQLAEEIRNKQLDEVEKETKQKEETIIQNEGEVLGRSKGVLSLVVNSIDSSSLYISIMQAINSVVKSTNIAMISLIVISLIVEFVIWYFIVNVYKVISRRIFLEGRIYDGIPKQRFLYLYRIKKWKQVSFTMFLKSIFQMLWSFTIVGGIIKHYSYFLVPYIVAENPEIKSLDAIKLSRKMMNGHKWECFVLELSFIWWDLLGILTFNISSILYSNQYKLATYSEYYSELRALAKKTNIENAELLNDTYLYEKADEALLKDTYKDIVELMEEKEEPIKKKKGIKGVLENIFGINVSSDEENKRYEEIEKKQVITTVYNAAISKRIYPTRLSPIPEKEKRKHIENVNYLRRYSISSLILLFFIFSFVGWIWEVILHLINLGEFINRGVLHGPWLPIYGAGGVVILVLLYRFRKNPILQFFVTTLVCGVIEYFTAYYLELTHNGQKWWDYTGYFLNLHGRICAEGLLIFGLGGLAIVYILAPLIDNHLKKIKPKVLVVCCTILVSLFTIDQIYSSKHPNEGKGITDYSITMNVEK